MFIIGTVCHLNVSSSCCDEAVADPEMGTVTAGMGAFAEMGPPVMAGMEGAVAIGVANAYLTHVHVAVM